MTMHSLIMLDLAKAQHQAALREAQNRRQLRQAAPNRTPAIRKFAAALAVTTLVASLLSVMASANDTVGSWLTSAPGGSAGSAQVR